MRPTNEKQSLTQSVTPATEAHDSGNIPFFSAESLPGESNLETSARRAFLSKADEALSIVGASIEQLASFFIEQKNLLAEMRNNITRQNFDFALWEMFESLMRDEQTSPDVETRADACIVYRWLQRVSNTVYSV